MPKDKNNLIFMTPEQLDEGIEDMTNTLKIPGKIVSIMPYPQCEGALYVATETQVYWSNGSRPQLVFDITNYQDKPTEKERREKKEGEEQREFHKDILANMITHLSSDSNSASEIIAAIAELNQMDGYHATGHIS